MLGFGAPIFLAAAAAVGLPIAIHFLTRARPRVIKYPPYKLLIEAGSGRQALNRLRTLLVLLARTVFVAALVLVFARPFLGASSAAPAPGAERRVALLVDASLSMRGAEGSVTLFAKAKAQAADVLRSLAQGSAAGVVLVGAEARPLLPALSRNRAALHEALAAAEPTYERGDVRAALAVAARMLEGRGEVFVFSDFQRTNWAAADFTALAGASVFLRSVAERSVANVGVTGIEKSPEQPIEGETLDLACTLFNASPETRLAAVKLDLAGVSQSVEVELKPYGSGTAAFSFALPAEGLYAGTVALGGDDLPADNTRYFKVEVGKALQVLLVSDAARENPQSAAFLVRTALNPSAYAATGIAVARRVSQEVDRGALETADAFFLVCPVTPSGESIEIIARRVLEGVPLVCMLDGATAPALVGALGGASGGVIAPPFALARPVAEQGEGRPFGNAVTARGPLALFHSPDQADLASVRFRRHFLAEDVRARAEEILVRFEDGSAALSFSPAGRGTAVFTNFPVTPDGGTLAGSPLFPSLLHELMRALRRTGQVTEPAPGAPWTLEFDSAGEGNDAAYRVTDMRDGEVAHTVVARGRTVKLALGPAAAPGHYTVSQGARRCGLGIVNVDARETDTRRIDPRELVARGDSTHVAVIDREGGLVHAGAPAELWPHMAALAAAALAVEMLLLAFWRRTRDRTPHSAAEGRAA